MNPKTPQPCPSGHVHKESKPVSRFWQAAAATYPGYYFRSASHSHADYDLALVRLQPLETVNWLSGLELQSPKYSFSNTLHSAIHWSCSQVLHCLHCHVVATPRFVSDLWLLIYFPRHSLAMQFTMEPTTLFLEPPKGWVYKHTHPHHTHVHDFRHLLLMLKVLSPNRY